MPGLARSLCVCRQRGGATCLGRHRDAGRLIQHGTRGQTDYTLGVIGPDRSAEEGSAGSGEVRPLTNAMVGKLTSIGIR